MGVALREGEAIPLARLLETRNTSLFVRATVRDENGAEISGSPFNVPHLSEGFYYSIAVAMPNTAYLTVEYDVFNDALFTEDNCDDLLPSGERFDLDEIGTTLDMLKVVARGTDLEAIISTGFELEAIIEAGEELEANIDNEELEAIIESSTELEATIETDNELEGEIK